MFSRRHLFEIAWAFFFFFLPLYESREGPPAHSTFFHEKEALSPRAHTNRHSEDGDLTPFFVHIHERKFKSRLDLRVFPKSRKLLFYGGKVSFRLAPLPPE